jgi:putative tryptophan/tyrosine transport system substrate-binding protein
MILRREFIAGLGSVAAWPVVARAQQGDRVRRIGVLTFHTESDPLGQVRIATFRQALREFGWTEGRNVRFDIRFGGGDADRYRTYAAELVALAPDVLLGHGPTVRFLLQATRTVPIVFVGLNDPVGAGYVASLARPGGNTTGFGGTEYSASAKSVQLLKQITPNVIRVALLRDPSAAGSLGTFGATQGAAAALGLEAYPIDLRSAQTIDGGLATFATMPNSGLIVPPLGLAMINRELIIKLAAHYRLPAVYTGRVYVADGGLASYGNANGTEFDRGAAGYVDRTLRGEKPADLPVQAPTRYETVINLKTARALGLEIPQTLLATADEVIE